MLIFFFFFNFFFLLRGVSLAHPVLALFLSGEFLLHIPCLHYFSVGSFSYTSHVNFFSLFFFFFFFFSSLGSFSNTSRAGIIFFIFYLLALFRHTYPMLASFLCVEFLLHILSWLPCLFILFFNLGSFYYTSRAGFYVWGVSLTHPMLALYLSGEFLIHIPFWLHFYLRSFSYTSHACFNFLSGISYTSKVGFFFFFFFLNILGSFSYTSRAGFIFMRGVSQTHPVLALFLSGEFLLHIPFLLYFSRGGWRGGAGALIQGSLSYTSHAGFFFFFFF